MKDREEFLRNLRVIYGNAQLDNKTMRQLKRVWKKNPNHIKNTAQQKMGELQMKEQSFAVSPSSNMPAPQLPTRSIYQQIEDRFDNGDYSILSNFGQAFNKAKADGREEFKWNSTKQNPSGRYATVTRDDINAKYAEQPKISFDDTSSQDWSDYFRKEAEEAFNAGSVQYQSSGSEPKENTVSGMGPLTIRKESFAVQPSTLSNDNMTIHGPWYKQPDNVYKSTTRKYSFSPENGFTKTAEQDWAYSNTDAMGNPVKGKPIAIGGKTKVLASKKEVGGKFQQGGSISNQEELQKAFMAFLIEDAAAQGMQIQSEQDLQAYAQQLGEEGLKAKYQEFMQKMQGGVKAALGAKLNYIHKLKGNCPEGEELVYMKQGGRMCPVCQKKAEKAEDGKKLQKKNAVSDFKEKRKNINPNDTVNTKFGPRDLNGKTKYPKYNAKKENYDYETRKRVQEKDEKSGKKVIGSACGSKMKKK